jgi:hypothetical protein
MKKEPGSKKHLKDKIRSWKHKLEPDMDDMLFSLIKLRCWWSLLVWYTYIHWFHLKYLFSLGNFSDLSHLQLRLDIIRIRNLVSMQSKSRGFCSPLKYTKKLGKCEKVYCIVDMNITVSFSSWVLIRYTLSINMKIGSFKF